jgi:Rps23 Pro-64 3,4-dihydroxylase Tpa1-like proline 4-hydroxylase
VEVSKPVVPTQVVRIDNKPIYIFDGLLSITEIERLYYSVAVANYSYWHNTHRSTQNPEDRVYRFLQTDFDIPDFPTTGIGLAFQSIVKSIDASDFLLERVFVMALRYGNTDYIHKDHFSSRRGISVVCYANLRWPPDWGGETIFYDKLAEPRLCIGVKPGRIIAFDGTVEHRAGVPARPAKAIRVSLNARYGIAK